MEEQNYAMVRIKITEYAESLSRTENEFDIRPGAGFQGLVTE